MAERIRAIRGGTFPTRQEADERRDRRFSNFTDWFPESAESNANAPVFTPAPATMPPPAATTMEDFVLLAEESAKLRVRAQRLRRLMPGEAPYAAVAEKPVTDHTSQYEFDFMIEFAPAAGSGLLNSRF